MKKWIVSSEVRASAGPKKVVFTQEGGTTQVRISTGYVLDINKTFKFVMAGKSIAPNRLAISRTPKLHFAPEPAHVFLQSGGEKVSISLQELVQSRCQSLCSKFRPAPWLFNAHLQTLYSVLGDFSKTDQVQYQRRLLRLLDGGTLGLDFVPANPSTVRDDAPIIVVQHGLTGGSHEPYIRAVLAPACSPVEQGGLGYRAVVVNFRGCSGVPLTSPKFYTAAQTDDLRQGLMYISKLYPKAPLLGLGFSIGGNVLVRYLAEEGVNSLICSACILGCPWDIKTNNDCESSAHSATAEKPTLTDFDHIFTCYVGDTPPFPFPDVHEYYTWAGSHKVADQIRVPCLTINAADDPVVQQVQMSSGQNGHIVSVLTAMGGHLGWFRSKRKRWTTKPVLEWIQLFGTELVRDPIELSLSTDDAGYLRAPRWPNLGCKEVPGGGLLDGNRPESQLLQGL
ncbi:AB-hydrolase YheT [Mycena olivaceomarginata]|nr:AB-hydrolase YheT [Mycena olivaceomarginata]